MASTFRLQILTQEGVKRDCQVQSVRAPGVLGSFGVRPGHAPMIAELTIGPLLIREADGKEVCFACSGGIMDISVDGVAVLADSIEEACEIDEARAEQALARARARLRMRRDPGVDVLRAEAALARAMNRLRTKRRFG